MFLSWLKNRRRRRLLAQPAPTSWAEHLEHYVRAWPDLNDAERRRLSDCARVIASEKQWEGCNGLMVTEEIKAAIAGQASLLLLHLPHDYFHHVKSILVYPSAYEVRETEELDAGVVVEGRGAVIGLAVYRGPVILSWADVVQGAKRDNDGRNVVLHEFAHQLDMLDEFIDGTPPLRNRAQHRAWVRIMTQHFQELRDQSRRGERTLLDDYGAENEAEFFAVATECFFERGRALQRRHLQLYDLLRDFYSQDPAQRPYPRQ